MEFSSFEKIDSIKVKDKKSGLNLFKKSYYLTSWDENWNRTLGALPSKFVLFSERLLVSELQENAPLEHLQHLEHAAFGL